MVSGAMAASLFKVFVDAQISLLAGGKASLKQWGSEGSQAIVCLLEVHMPFPILSVRLRSLVPGKPSC